MSLKKSFTKKISLLLILSLLSLNLSFLTVPKKTNAQWAVADVGAYGFFTTMTASLAVISAATGVSSAANTASGIWDTAGKYTVEAALAALGKKVAIALIRQLTQATVDWINSGFNGNPAYIADFGKFMLGENGVTDQAIGDFFASEPGLRFLCDPFRIQVSLALSLEYSTGFANRIGCTFSEIANNVTNAQVGGDANINVNGTNIISGSANKSLSEGGWDAWLQTTLIPQNNPIGAYLIAKNELDTRIATAKTSATTELITGQGSLSFKKCKDTYYHGDGGQFYVTAQYIDNANNRPGPPSDFNPSAGDHRVQNCTVKTPGATITEMLGFKATSDGRITELQAATANGIDSIIGALLNSLINNAINKIREGILDDNYSTSEQDLDYLLNNADNQIQETYNNQIDDIHDGEVVDPSQIISSLYPTPTPWNPYNLNPYSTSGSSVDYIFSTSTDGYTYANSTESYTYSTSTRIYTYKTPTGSYTYSTSTDAGLWNPYPSIPAYDVLGNAKKNSISLLNSLSKAEWTYQDTYKFAEKVLLGGKSVFASSSVCNMNVNKNDYTLRSLLIRANVTTNIDGEYDSNRTIASIPWNLKIIKPALEKSAANLAILNKAAFDVNSASSITTLNDAMVRVNSTAFHTDPEIKMVENIKTWLRGTRDMYNTPLCPIDVTKVLQMSSATSTIN